MVSLAFFLFSLCSEELSTTAGKRATVTSILSSLLLWFVVTVLFMFCSWRKRQLEWQRRAANKQSFYYRYGGAARGPGGGAGDGGGPGQGTSRAPACVGDQSTGQQQQQQQQQQQGQDDEQESVPPELRVTLQNFLGSFIRPPPEPSFSPSPQSSSTPLTPPAPTSTSLTPPAPTSTSLTPPTPTPAASVSRVGRQQQRTRQEEEEDEDEVVMLSRGEFTKIKTFAVRGMTAAARRATEQQELTSSPELSPPPPPPRQLPPPESGYVSQYHQEPSAPPAVTDKGSSTASNSSYESTRGGIYI